MLFKLASPRMSGGGGSLADKLMPGYKDRIWERVPDEWKLRIIRYENWRLTRDQTSQENFYSWFNTYKQYEKKFVPSEKFRKPSIDWRRQNIRGTLHTGRPFEGPAGSDYLPGNTRDRLETLIPFSEAEWNERKAHRTFDGLKVALYLWLGWLALKVTRDVPVVWAEEETV